MKKKILSLILAGVMMAASLAACQTPGAEPANNDSTQAPDDGNGGDASDTDSPAADSGKDIKLTFSTNVIASQADALEKVLQEFTAETGIQVEFTAPGESYEELMKTKMASNQLPDVFTTHGWSVLRYSEYLEPVNDLSFADNIIDQMKSVITDEDGKIYVLPIDADIAGIIYNLDVLEAADVNVDDIKTWDDFTDACQKIKDSGVTPIHIGGKDSWPIGQIGDWVAPSVFVTNENDNARDELKSGTFDTDRWEKVAGILDSWVKSGFVNEDAMTADYDSDAAALAENKSAFAFYGNSTIVDVQNINSEVRLGMMPVPSNSADDEPSLIAGERIAVGVWKDSPEKEAAIQLLEFLARPENVKIVASSSGCPAGLKGVESDIGDIQTYIDKYSTVRTFSYFDREYLPSGMWDVICSTGADVVSQKDNAVENAAKVMQQNFDDKFSQD